MLKISFKDALQKLRSGIIQQLLRNLAAGDTLTLDNLRVLGKLR
ncbi:hypothetical protein [Nostoc mirabile]|nr:hypothetical protein [Nostoc mirabile]